MGAFPLQSEHWQEPKTRLTTILHAKLMMLSIEITRSHLNRYMSRKQSVSLAAYHEQTIPINKAINYRKGGDL